MAVKLFDQGFRKLTNFHAYMGVCERIPLARNAIRIIQPFMKAPDVSWLRGSSSLNEAVFVGSSGIGQYSA